MGTYVLIPDLVININLACTIKLQRIMVNGIIDLSRLSKNKQTRWSSASYPMGMNNLAKSARSKALKSVRNKAIEMANSLITSKVVDESAIVLDAICRVADFTQKRKYKNISIENIYSKVGFNFPYHL